MVDSRYSACVRVFQTGRKFIEGFKENRTSRFIVWRICPNYMSFKIVLRCQYTATKVNRNRYATIINKKCNWRLVEIRKNQSIIEYGRSGKYDKYE